MIKLAEASSRGLSKATPSYLEEFCVVGSLSKTAFNRRRISNRTGSSERESGGGVGRAMDKLNPHATATKTLKLWAGPFIFPFGGKHKV